MLKKRRPPFVVAYKAILRDPKLSLEAKAVLLIIKAYANNDGTHCFPSINKLCTDSGCSRRSLSRHLKELRDNGLIFSEQNITKGKQKSTCTYLLYDDLKARSKYVPKQPKQRADFGTRPMQKMAHGSTPKIVPFTEENRKAV